MSKCILFVLFIIIGSLIPNAQEMRVTSISPKVIDNSAIQRPVLDNSKDTCALLKVYAPITDISFDGNVVEQHKSASCYWVYIVGNTRKITAYHRFMFPVDIVCSNFGLKKFNSGKTYDIHIEIPSELANILKQDASRIKMTQKRFKMLELHRKYLQADSLYRLASHNRGEKRLELLEQSSKLGWPLATKTLLKSKGTILPEQDSTFVNQSDSLNMYLDWLYDNLKSFDQRFGEKAIMNCTIQFSHTPTIQEITICELEIRIKHLINSLLVYTHSHNPTFENICFQSNSEIHRDTSSKYFLFKRTPPFELSNKEALFIFYQIKSLINDILLISETLPNFKIHFSN